MQCYIPEHVVVAKRFFDVSVSLVALILCLPLFPLIALLIKLDSRGPVFFRQMRIGTASENHVNLFMMIKFRTMAKNAESSTGPVWAAKNDVRITRIGRFLRKTRLDEIPQFFNVLAGDMSVIGPRPERPGFCGKLEKNIPYFTERTFDLLPGITGLSQINQGYDRNIEDVRNKLAYDLSYSLCMTNLWGWFKADLNIVFGTVKVMVLGRGQ